MNTPDHTDPLESLLNRPSAVVVRPDFLDRVIAATVAEPQEKDDTIIPFTAPRRAWVKLASLAAAAAVVLGLWISLRHDDPNSVAETPMGKVLVDDTLEQELVAVDDMQTMISLEDPSELDDAQLLSLLN